MNERWCRTGEIECEAAGQAGRGYDGVEWGGSLRPQAKPDGDTRWCGKRMGWECEAVDPAPGIGMYGRVREGGGIGTHHRLY